MQLKEAMLISGRGLINKSRDFKDQRYIRFSVGKNIIGGDCELQVSEMQIATFI